MKAFDSYKTREIILDGTIYYGQKVGGISRLFTEILPRICRTHEEIRVRILLTNRNIQPLPRHKHISYQRTYEIESFLRPRRFWRANRIASIKNTYNALLSLNSKNQIWHSTYYTLPKKWKGAVITTVYDLIFDRFRDSYYADASNDEIRKRMKDAAIYSDKVIAISQATKQDLKSIYGIADEKILVIHLACSDIFRQAQYQKHYEKPFVLYVGNRWGYKNFGGLLKSFSIWSRNSDVDLMVVGPAWSNEESKSIAELKMSEKVRLVPNADDSVLRDLYNQALAFIYPSLYEGFGIPVLEAMSCGCPIIASRIPSTVEIANDIPIYHEPGNQDELLSNLDEAFDETRQSKRVFMGLKHVMQYSWESTARQTAQLYQNFNLSQ